MPTKNITNICGDLEIDELESHETKNTWATGQAYWMLNGTLCSFPPNYEIFQKGLIFISNRQRRKEGTFCASGLAGIEPMLARPNEAGYVRLNLSAISSLKFE
jgi:hypothetical protein